MEDERVVNYVQAGKRIREARMKRAMSQEELANAASLSIQYMSLIENARSKASLSTFIKIANALNLTLNDLLYDSLSASDAIYKKEVDDLLKGCTTRELRLITAMIKALKDELKNYDSGRHVE